MALITTTHGGIDESELTKREGVCINGAWVEYYLGDELVHRSVTIALNPLWPMSGVVGSFEKYGQRWEMRRWAC